MTHPRESKDWTRKPPSWAKGAIATTAGWTDSKTGEVLIAIRGLKVMKKNAHVGITETAPPEPKYAVTCPDGQVIIIENIPQFARDHKLQNTHLYKVLRGKAKQHKGYTIKRHN